MPPSKKPTGQSQLPTGIALAWGLRASATKGPKPGLSLEQIVTTAIELADAGGLAAVSMSKLAEALGFTTMSLYRYVRSKDDLILLMNDAALGTPPALPDHARDWRAKADAWTHAILSRYREHPWTLDVPITGVPAVPNQLDWLEQLLQALEGTDLSYQEKLSTTLLLSGYARYWAELSRGIEAGDEQRTEAGEEPMDYRAAMGALIDPERYPALAPMIAAGEFNDDDEDFDDVFRFAIDRILDGMAILIESRSTSVPDKQRRKTADRTARTTKRSERRGTRE